MGNELNEGNGERKKENQEEYGSSVAGEGAKKEVRYAAGKPFFDNQLQREWLSTEEAAFYLSVTVGALRNMVYRGQVASYRIGKRVRFRVEDCRRLFERKGA